MIKRYWPILTILLVVLLAFYPIFGGRIPLNARNLVSFFSPWYYQKFPGFPAGVPSKPGMPDQLRLYFPYMALTQRSYQQGQLPLWNPYNFAGNPHAAESQSGVFYPLHILLPILPLPVYWTFFQMVGFFLAGLFTYWYLRNLGLTKITSLFGGTTFMLSSFMSTWNMEVVTAPHSILWLPLVLLAIDKLLSKKQKTKNKKQWWMMGLAGLMMSILSGYWQTTFYVMVVAVTYLVFRCLKLENWKLKIPKLALGILVWFPLALSLTAFQLWPTWELYQRSGRPIVNARPEIQKIYLDYLLPLRHLVTLFAPDYFGHPTTRNYFANVGGGSQYYEHTLFVGTIPLMLAILGVFYALKKRSGIVLFWFILSIVAASFSFRNPLAKLVYNLHVPILSTGIANRILFVPAFGVSVLAAYGWQFAREKSSQKILNIVIGAGIFLIFVLFSATLFDRSGLGENVISIRNMMIPTVVFVFGSFLVTISIGKRRWANVALLGVLAISAGQNLYQHYKFTPFSEKDFVYPLHSTIDWLKTNAGINRFIGYNGQFLNNNFATYFQIYAVEGYDSLNDYRRSLLLHSADTGNISDPLNRSVDALLGQNLTNPQIVRLMQLFGIRYLIDHPEWLDVGPTAGLARLPEESEKLVFEDGDWKIWEYLEAYPRAFLAGNYEIVTDGQEMIDRLYSRDFSPRETLLLSGPPPEGFEIKSDDAGSVSIEKYTPMKIIFKTKSKTSQLLFLSDTYYPGWWYRVDNGEKQPVFMADFALRAALVPAGEHTVSMWYFPDSFKNAVMAAALAVAATTVMVTSRRFWPNKDR